MARLLRRSLANGGDQARQRGRQRPFQISGLDISALIFVGIGLPVILRGLGTAGAPHYSARGISCGTVFNESHLPLQSDIAAGADAPGKSFVAQCSSDRGRRILAAVGVVVGSGTVSIVVGLILAVVQRLAGVKSRHAYPGWCVRI
jgi:hypothetical protein